MTESIAIVGGGVSGLTCGSLFVERGYRTSIFAETIGQKTTSGAAAALWFPYDAEPAEKVIPWARATFDVLIQLAQNVGTGVSMIELGQFSRTGEIQIPEWARSLGARPILSGEKTSPVQKSTSVPLIPSAFRSGFSITVPLMDTTIYLDYLADRFRKAGGEINANIRLNVLEDIDAEFDVVINCAGIGARELVGDADLEPHRGQVVIVPPHQNFSCAIVCDDPPLMYSIPRRKDCIWGGTNQLSDHLDVDPAVTEAIISECSQVLSVEHPKILGQRVGLRPFRKSGVRIEPDRLADGRLVIHNYGHGGSGFTLSWGCADEVLRLSTRQA